MIPHDAYPAEPWQIRETHLDLGFLAQSESIFALGNGHLGLRANLDEGEPRGLSGTYLNGFYESVPLLYGEGGYGYPEDGQTVVNVPDGKIIRLLVEDEPLDVHRGYLEHHERVLDLRAGTLTRTLRWTSEAGQTVKVTTRRLVSLHSRSTAAISYEVEAVDEPLRVAILSSLLANQRDRAGGDDPRGGKVLENPLSSRLVVEHEQRVVMVHTTKRSGLTVASGMEHLVDTDRPTMLTQSEPDLGRVTISAKLDPGEPLRLVKLLAYHWSSQQSVEFLRDQVDASLENAVAEGWDGLARSQRAYLDEYWKRADVEVEGDVEIQQAVRFALLHVLQASARAESRAIPAKGLTGPGYDGHAFWDTESFVLPVLCYTRPDLAAEALRWRHSTLDLARQRAKELGLRGAAFPWRTIHGEECSGYWPAGTAAFHVNADIAGAIYRYWVTTGDAGFASEIGLELLVETARLWDSLGHFDGAGRFRIDGVTGPDEYSAMADNNLYTNVMAQRNLRSAAAGCERLADRAKELGVGQGEITRWKRAADAMTIHYDETLGIHPQDEGFLAHATWDFASTKPEQYPLLLHFHYFDLYRKQVVKQADLVLALHVCGDSFSEEEKARDFAYYEALTVRDSSLSACTQAVVAAEVGHLELAYDYFGEAALMDLRDLEHNTRDGVHIASLAGAWMAAVAGFGGMREHGGNLTFAPRLPARLQRLTFRLLFRGRSLKVDASRTHATYILREGEPLEIGHHGRTITVTTDAPVVEAIPPLAERPAPTQPYGRAPARRGIDGD
ncbi:MAG: glycoside hydrolase family 65 protein [Solirubrobacteraceae bacterium]